MYPFQFDDFITLSFGSDAIIWLNRAESSRIGSVEKRLHAFPSIIMIFGICGVANEFIANIMAKMQDNVFFISVFLAIQTTNCKIKTFHRHFCLVRKLFPFFIYFINSYSAMAL